MYERMSENYTVKMKCMKNDELESIIAAQGLKSAQESGTRGCEKACDGGML
jgi:hypothetical protein